MAQFRFLKAPGYIYDIFYIFSLYFNREEHLSSDVNASSVEADAAFLNQMIQDFSPISDEIELFFHRRKDGRILMPKYCFEPYQDHFATDYSFDFLMQILMNHDQLIEKLIEFYFPDMGHDDVLMVKSSLVEMSKQIDASQYDEHIKRRLYSFFINPEPIIQKLVYELMAKELMLSQYYEKNYQKIVSVQNDFDFDEFAEAVKGFRNIDFLNEEKSEVYFSVCLINKNCVNFFLHPQKPVILLGYNYIESIKDFFSRKHHPSLKEFGDVITEQNRIDILNLLVERKEVTIKDLEKLLDFSGSTAYYHLTMMTRCNMVKTRNQGKTVFYSLNQHYFESIIEVLSKYLKKD